MHRVALDTGDCTFNTFAKKGSCSIREVSYQDTYQNLQGASDGHYNTDMRLGPNVTATTLRQMGVILTAELLPEKPEPILLARIYEQVSALGSIHRSKTVINSP